MEALAKFVFAIMLLSLISKGYCKCTWENITYGDLTTDRQIQGVIGEQLGVRPIDIRNLIILNYCECPVSDMILYCRGFVSLIEINPSIFKKIDDDHCLVNAGRPLLPYHSVRFDYAGDPVYMKATSFKAKC